ncbi:MAG: caspase family protein [Hydrogenophaga sp.]|nr:caspase family protein [Hydrogenophaga sp.]
MLALCLLVLGLGLPSRANAPPVLPITGERIALVLGNAAYSSSALLNPGNDARAIGQLLTTAGFSVDLLLDASTADMRAAIQRMEERLRDPRVKTALFYYAGHAVQLDWRNFLIGVDSRIRRIEDVPRQSVDLSDVLKRFGDAKRQRDKQLVVVLDACRDNPFRSDLRLSQKGLSQFDAPPNTLVAFSTAPGQVAFDGEGNHSFYTATLLRELAVPYVSIEDALKRVRMGVRVASLGRQVPWESTSLEQSFFLYPSDKVEAINPEALENAVKRELEAWDRAKGGGDITSLVAFLQDFPNGNFSQLAQFRLDGMLHRRAQDEAVVVAQRQRGLEDARRAETAQEAANAALVQQQLTAAREAEAQRQRDAQQNAQQQAAQQATQQAQVQQAAVEARRAEERRRLDQLAEAAQRERQARETAARQQAAAQVPVAPLPQADVAAAGRTVATVEVVPTALETELLATAQRLQMAPPVPLATLAQYTPITQDRVATVPGFDGAEPLDRQFVVGDQWSYKVLDRFSKRESRMDLRVTGVDAAADRVSYNNGQFYADLMGNATSTNMGALDSPRQFYPATLQVGKRWVSNFVQRQSSGVQRFRYDVRVAAKENVTVPAGQFMTYRIEATGFNLDTGGTIRRVLWVTPGINANVALEVEVRRRDNSLEQTYRWELASYSGRRQSPVRPA